MSQNERAPRIVPDEMPAGAPRILGTVKRHPHLLEPMLRFSSAIAAGALTRRASEILALRAAWNCASDFEWGHHTRYALDAGLSEKEIARLAGEGPEAGWSDAEAALVRAADQLHEGQDIDDATWSVLAAHFDEGQLIEIPFVVGQYTMLSMIAKATDVPVDPDLPRWPEGRVPSPASRR